MKKIKFIFFAFLITLCSCNVKNADAIEVSFSIDKNEEFSDIVIVGEKNILENNGIKLGDSLDVIFSNGKKLEDVPYYSGFYCKTDYPLVINYPSYDTIRIAIVQGNGAFDEYNLKKSDTGIIRLRERGKYLQVEKAFNLTITNNRDDYDSDEKFANFREIKGGTLKNNFIYRGCSPIDNISKRANTAEKLIKMNNIKTVLNLGNDEKSVTNLLNDISVDNLYYRDLFIKNNVLTLGMKPAYKNNTYKQKLANGLKRLIYLEPPYYIHCTEGKDRTGFVCILLESLSNFSLEEIEKDYMLSYINFYKIDKKREADKYNIIKNVKFLDMIYYLIGVDDDFDESKINNNMLKDGAVNYLVSCGLEKETISKLIYFLNDSGEAY